MAYLLDTNVLSETVKAQPDPQVVAWLEETPLESAKKPIVNHQELSAITESRRPASENPSAFR
jgi:predicted nucleic acid-binding protein